MKFTLHDHVRNKTLKAEGKSHGYRVLIIGKNGGNLESLDFDKPEFERAIKNADAALRKIAKPKVDPNIITTLPCGCHAVVTSVKPSFTQRIALCDLHVRAEKMQNALVSLRVYLAQQSQTGEVRDHLDMIEEALAQ